MCRFFKIIVVRSRLPVPVRLHDRLTSAAVTVCVACRSSSLTAFSSSALLTINGFSLANWRSLSASTDERRYTGGYGALYDTASGSTLHFYNTEFFVSGSLGTAFVILFFVISAASIGYSL